MADNLAIWHAVEKTDPDRTKPITGKGYKGTSTNATYLAMRATEMFGPCGIGWGVKVLDERVFPCGAEQLHRVHIQFWYLHEGKRGEIEHFGQTILCGVRKSGDPFTDEDAPKKSLTDAMTKAMSLLGFAADIHLGLYDDNKYVAELKREKAEANEEARAEPVSAREKALLHAIELCETEEALTAWAAAAENKNGIGELKPEAAYRVRLAWQEKRKSITRKAA